MQEPSYLGEIILVLTWFKRIDLNNKSGTQRFSHLKIPTKYQYLTSIGILMLANRFFDTMRF